MAQIFDVMATVNGQLNMLAKYFSGESKSIRALPNVPDFIMISLNRGLNILPDLVIDKEKEVEVRSVILADTGDDFNPVYIAVVDNLNYPFVDKIPVIINHKDITGPGIAYGVYIPRDLFDSEYPEEAAVALKKIYFGLLELDSNMKYKPELAIIKYSESPKLKVSTYDLTMMYVALGCIDINLKAWFSVHLGKGKYGPVGSEYVIDLFEDTISDEMKSTINDALEKYGTKIGNLRDSIGSGSLLSDILFPKKK